METNETAELQKSLCDLAGTFVGFCGGYSVRKLLLDKTPEAVNELVYRVGVYGAEVLSSAMIAKAASRNFNDIVSTIRTFAKTAKASADILKQAKEEKNVDSANAGRDESETE